MARPLAQDAPQPVAGRLPDLVRAKEVRGAELVGLVDDDEVPPRRLQPVDVLVLFEQVDAADDQVLLGEGVAGGAQDLPAADAGEVQPELVAQLILPLHVEGGRHDDQAALDVGPQQQLLDEQAGHDGLARARVVGKEEAEGLPRQHLIIDSRELVRQRLHARDGDGKLRIEQVGQPEPLRFQDEAKEPAVGVKRPDLLVVE